MDSTRSTLLSVPTFSASAVAPEKSHPSKSFPFPKRLFGPKGCFKAAWCEKLHAAFCYLCMMTEVEKKFKESTKLELTFILKVYYKIM